MPMRKILLLPEQSGYAVSHMDNEVVSSKLDGGSSKSRRDQLHASLKVSVSYLCTAEEYQYLRAFYAVLGNGADAFLADLIIDDVALTEHVCKFIPGSIKLTKVQGLTYSVKADLEVVPQSGIDYAGIVGAYTP